jgi:hypothetical protein
MNFWYEPYMSPSLRFAEPSSVGIGLSAKRRSSAGRQKLNSTLNREGKNMMNFGYSGILGLLILAGDIWAIINIFQSSASNEKKLIWILAVVLLPVLGLILWLFLGPRDRKA